MDITKIQKIVRKAIKDYSITAKYDEEILVSFLSVDIFREISADDLSASSAPPRNTPRNRSAGQNALGQINLNEGSMP